MRLRRGRGEQPDPAEEAVTSELGWVKVDVDLRQWIPLAFAFPDGYDLDLWATTAATAWLAQWEPPVESPEVERLATMIRAIHKSADAHLQCHQIWIYLPDWFTTPLPVCIAIWRQSGERRRRLRLLTGADDKSCTPKPRVTKVATGRLGTGLRVLRQRAQGDNGQPVAMLAYAFRVEEHETDLQVFAVASDPLPLMAAGAEIKRLVEGITVYRNTDEPPVTEP